MIGYQGRNRDTVNYLKTIYFDDPEWVPWRVDLPPATWMRYREDLEQVILAHPRLFPGYQKGTKDFDQVDNPLYELGQHVDCWGTVWYNARRGLDSHPIQFPLTDWANLDNYIPPDPWRDDMFGPRDWEQVARALNDAKRRGDLAVGGGLPHGFMYQRLCFLRGFDHLMVDMGLDDPRLHRLIEIVEGYNTAVIRKYLDLGAERMSFGDDLGMQSSLPMSPAMWRKFVKPSYERMFRPCREADVPIYLHSDGHIVEIIPDLIEVGVTILNPQLRANGLEALRETARGKIALHQEVDAQFLPTATPSEIQDHVDQIFEALYMPEGGLMLLAECAPDVPLENIEAVLMALERVCAPPEQ